MESQVRQNYHRDCEAAINRMVNMEMFASYTYTSMVRKASCAVFLLFAVAENVVVMLAFLASKCYVHRQCNVYTEENNGHKKRGGRGVFVFNFQNKVEIECRC